MKVSCGAGERRAALNWDDEMEDWLRSCFCPTVALEHAVPAATPPLTLISAPDLTSQIRAAQTSCVWEMLRKTGWD